MSVRVPAGRQAALAVTITGTNFAGATAVMFEGTEAANVMLRNATTITATVPAVSSFFKATVCGRRSYAMLPGP